MNTSAFQSCKIYFSEAWETFKRNPLFILRVYIVVFVVSTIFNFISENINTYQGIIPFSRILQFLVSLASLYANTLIYIGLTMILLHLVRKERAQIKELFSYSVKVIKTFCVSFCLALGTIIGFIFFIVPGIIFFLNFHFAIYLIIEKNISIKDAFKQSKKMIEKKKWYLFRLYSLIVLASIFFLLFFAMLIYLFFIFLPHTVLLIIAILMFILLSFVMVPIISLVCTRVYDVFLRQYEINSNPQMVADSLPLAR